MDNCCRGKAIKQFRIVSGMSLLCISSSLLAFDVQIDGVEGEVSDNISAYTRAIKASEFTEARLEGEIRRRVAEAMRPFGYYEPDIDLTLESGNDGVSISVDPGQPVTIDVLSLQLDGDASEDSPFISAVDNFPLEQGDVLRHSPWDSLVSRLSTLALERGYFNWRFADRRMEVRPYLNSARLYMHFDSGQRYRFGDIHIKGSHIEPERLENMRPFELDAPYLAESIAEYNQRLSETGWFNAVSVRPRLTDPAELMAMTPDEHSASLWWQEATGRQMPDTDSTTINANISVDAVRSALRLSPSDRVSMPIDISVQPADRHNFEIGVGFASDVGPRMSFSWQQPWVNRFGHGLDNDLYVSAPEQRLSGEYTIPLDDPLKDSYELQYGIKHEDDNDTRSLEGSLQIARRWKFDNDWEQTIYLRTTYEDFTQGGESDKVWLLYPGVQWTRTRTREQRFPVWGDRQRLSIDYSDTFYGSDARFLRVDGETQWIRMIGNDNRFIGGVGLGAIETDDFDRIPPSLRFFAGGDRSVRGYSYESLSPLNEEGRLRGGQQRLTASLEYQRRVKNSWWSAAFVDTGDAFDDWGPDNLKTGAGLGVRWISPVGPIRLDVAHPFDHEDDWRLHFSIGPEF
ncbi:autotransporter assembly complex family protein [Vreelandella aquamarina]|uniref:autotransporter assembly complex protein TamA n=1 Tax=Vreelandella aquamarina TaxID=77097 RepID=UPI00384E525A